MMKILIVVIVLMVIAGCGDKSNINVENKEQKKEENKEPEITEVKSNEDARINAVGTWQFIAGDVWHKYIIKNDGSYEYFMAEPRNGRWSQNSGGTWDVGSDRYNDTGNKYYYISVKYKTESGLGKNKKYSYSTLKFIYKNTKTIYSENFLYVDRNPLGFKTDISPWKD